LHDGEVRYGYAHLLAHQIWAEPTDRLGVDMFGHAIRAEDQDRVG
jgi:hypothetical protein